MTINNKMCHPPSLICSQYSRQRNNKKFSTNLLGAFSMSKRRSKHTLDERIEAVLRVIEGRMSTSKIAKEYFVYHTARKYNVSYQQVYSWTRKYEKGGEQVLHDRCGKTLESKQTLTEDEKLQLHIKELEHRNKYLEAKNGLLKKLKEVERRMGLRDKKIFS